MSRVLHCGRVCVRLAAFAAVIGWAGWAIADMVPNGGFDTDLSGWSMSDGGWGWYDTAATGSPDGPAAIFLGGADAWLYQPGDTTPPAFVEGQTYELSFLAAQGNGGSATMEVDLITGSGTHSVSITPTGTWQQYGVVFTATAADVGHSFQPGFLGVGGSVMGVDSVRLDAIPEPSTLVLLGAGLAGLLAYAWRKRK
jgi:hypothetical protein